MVLSMSDILNETSIWNDYDISGKPVLIDSGLYEKVTRRKNFTRKISDFRDL